MSIRNYRLTVIACVLSSFMVGLHLPALHAMTHHGNGPSWSALAITAMLGVVALGGLGLLLLRAPAARRE